MKVIFIELYTFIPVSATDTHARKAKLLFAFWGQLSGLIFVWFSLHSTSINRIGYLVGALSPVNHRGINRIFL